MARRKTTLLLAACTLLVMLAWLVWPSGEVAYKGRSLSEWLERVRSTNALECSESVAAIRAIGTNAEPILLGWLQRQDSSFARWLLGLLAKAGAPVWDPNGYRATLRDRFSANYSRSKAVFGFQVLGTQAYDSTPALQNMLTNPATRFDAAVAMTSVAPELAKRIVVEWSKSTNTALTTDAWRIDQEMIDQIAVRRLWAVP